MVDTNACLVLCICVGGPALSSGSRGRPNMCFLKAACYFLTRCLWIVFSLGRQASNFANLCLVFASFIYSWCLLSAFSLLHLHTCIASFLSFNLFFWNICQPQVLHSLRPMSLILSLLGYISKFWDNLASLCFVSLMVFSAMVIQVLAASDVNCESIIAFLVGSRWQNPLPFSILAMALCLSAPYEVLDLRGD